MKNDKILLPLVSVIVRTKDRPKLLSEALTSLTEQIYSNIEVVVINDGGNDVAGLLEGFKQYFTDFRYVFLKANRGRAAAANEGLDTASGDYLIFLDDDDLLDTEHISLLLEALYENPQYQVAYSGVRLVGQDKTIIFNRSYDPFMLRAENYIPIHAVLFSRDLLTAGCRFDTGFVVYEDWDFWLQLSQLTDFIHVNKVTATYRTFGDSGINPVLAEDESVHRAKAIIFDKWRLKWTGAQVDEVFTTLAHYQQSLIMQQQNEIHRLDCVAGELNEKIHVSEQRLQDKENRLLANKVLLTDIQNRLNEQAALRQEREREIQTILSSTSWKVSAPIRWIGNGRKNLKIVFSFLFSLMRFPRKIPSAVIDLFNVWNKKGLGATKRLMMDMGVETTCTELWNNYLNQVKNKTPEIQQQITMMEKHPLISILVPVYNTPKQMLKTAIDSVCEQIYPYWELCLEDDGSTKDETRNVLKEYAKRDKRIKVNRSDLNQGISVSTNHALKRAGGDFVVLLDHDDILPPHALYRIASVIINKHPDMIYSDEAQIASNGKDLINFVFRPSFSLELLRSHPYIVHLTAFRTEMIRELGGLDTSLDISQDYDLILRASERAKTIVHIPEVLYLWRQHQNSTGHEKKKDVSRTSRKILSKHLERSNLNGKVIESNSFNFYETRYPLEGEKKVAIIIPTKNHGDLVRQCIESIERTVREVAYDIVLVDHASNDPLSKSYFRQLQKKYKVLTYNGPFNFSAINNWAISQLNKDYTHYLFCNNDIEAREEGWLERMMELGQQPDIGIVGALLLYPDGRIIQHGGVCVGMMGIAEHFGKFVDKLLPDGKVQPGQLGALITNHELSAVTAACMLVKKEAFDAAIAFDEELKVGFGDVDLCLRIGQQGFRVIFCPHAVLIHHESASRGKSTTDPHPDDSALFIKKWESFLLKTDPFFNPNYTLYNTAWQYKAPMEFKNKIHMRVYKNPRRDI